MVDPLNPAFRAPARALTPTPSAAAAVPTAVAPARLDQVQGSRPRVPSGARDAGTNATLDVLGLPTVGESFSGMVLEADPAAVLGLVQDGYAHLGIGFRPGADMGLVSVPTRSDGSTRPNVYANTSVLIQDGRWVTDGERARAGSSLGPRDRGWLAETSRSERNRERTLIYLSDENGNAAELDGPLWFDPDRVYLTDDGRILADVPCLPDSWFDFTKEITGQERIDPNDPAGLARAFLPEPIQFGGDDTATGPGGDEPRSPQVESIVNALAQDSMRIFGAGGTLRPGRLRLGSGREDGDGIFLNVAEGSSIRVEGDLGNLTTTLDVNYSSFNLIGGGSSINTGDGSAQITVVTRFQRDPTTGEYDFSQSPSIDISVAGLTANDTQLNLVGADGGVQTFRAGRLEASGTGAPEISIRDGVTRVDLDDASLFDLRGGIQLPGQKTPFRLGGGDGRGQGVTLENVRLRYDSVSEVVELEGMTSSRPNPAGPSTTEETAFAVRVGSWEIIDGEIADVDLDITLGEGAIDVPNGSRFNYRSGGVGYDARRMAERLMRLEDAAARRGLEFEPDVLPYIAEKLHPTYESMASPAETVIGRLAAAGATNLDAAEQELGELLLPRATFGLEAPHQECWRFSGNFDELELGQSAAEAQREPENRLSSVLNSVNARFSDETSGEACGRAVHWTEGQVPVLEDFELDVDVVVEELGIPLGIGEPIRFYGGTGGNLSLSLNRNEGDPFFDGDGEFQLILGGEAQQQAQGIQGLEDADVFIRADAGDAVLDGTIVLGADGRFRLESNLDASGLDVDIGMESGTPPERAEPLTVERREEPLGEHRPLEEHDLGAIRPPVPARESTGQSPIDFSIPAALDAFIDDGQMNLSIPTENVATGAFNLDFREVRPRADLVGARVDVQNVRTQDGSFDFNLTFTGNGDDSRVDLEQSGITLTHPIEFDLDVAYHREDPSLIETVPASVTGRISELSLVPDGDGQFRIVPNFEFDEFDVFGVGVNWLASRERVNNVINRALGEQLLTQPLFGQGTLPTSRDELMEVLEAGGLGAALNMGDQPLIGPMGEAGEPQSRPSIDQIIAPEEMLDAALGDLDLPEIDAESELMAYVMEKARDLSLQDRRNAITAAQQLSTIFDINGTTLTVRDDDGEGGIQIGDRRLDLGNGQYIDFGSATALEPGTELEIDVTPTGGLVISGNANLDAVRIGQPGDDFHVDLSDLRTEIELRVTPVEGQETPVVAVALINTSGSANMIDALVQGSELRLEGTEISLPDTEPELDEHGEPIPQNLITARFGGGTEFEARFFLPNITSGTMSYRTDMDRIQPNWTDSQLDISRARVESASLAFDGQSLSTIEPLRVSELDAVVTNIEEDVSDQQTIRLKRASIEGHAELLLLPGGNLGIYSHPDPERELVFRAITNAFDLVTTGPQIEAPISEYAWLVGLLKTLQFGPIFGTRVQISNGDFSGETGEGQIFIGPADSQVETIRFDNGRIEGHIASLLYSALPGEDRTLEAELTYELDGDIMKGLEQRGFDSETLAALGIQITAGGAFQGTVMMSGAASIGRQGWAHENRSSAQLAMRGYAEATGIDLASTINTFGGWLRDFREAPPQRREERE